MQTLVKNDHVVISFDSGDGAIEGFYQILLNKLPISSGGQNKYVVNMGLVHTCMCIQTSLINQITSFIQSIGYRLLCCYSVANV